MNAWLHGMRAIMRSLRLVRPRDIWANQHQAHIKHDRMPGTVVRRNDTPATNMMALAETLRDTPMGKAP